MSIEDDRIRRLEDEVREIGNRLKRLQERHKFWWERLIYLSIIVGLLASLISLMIR